MSKFRNFDNYEIYADGSIFSYWTNKWLKPITQKNGYQVVWLVDNDGKKKKYLLHRVIYETFSGEPIPPKMQCNHISEDKTDCSFANINLLTPKENINWGSRTERMIKTKSKQVGAFKNGELVMVFTSTMEAGRNGFDHSHIVDCCNGKRKTHRGFEWRYL